MKIASLIILFILSNVASAQNQNSIWMFGDSAGINFSNINNPIPIHSSVKSRGSCASICDKGGNIKFYYGASADFYYFLNDPHENGNIWNKNNEIMVGGDSIFTKLWYNEGVIVSSPADSNIYYVFNIGITSIYGLYFSIINMTQDSGRGAVTQKNIQLENWEAVDCLFAVKHGNGKDWWVIAKKATHFQGTNLNEWYLYLVDSTGIHPQPLQVVGSNFVAGLGDLKFNFQTNKICFLSRPGLLEIYDFDRCTGIISNPVTISNEGDMPYSWSAEFSPSGQYLYTSTSGNTVSYIYQFDLFSSNIPASKTIIDSIEMYQAGGHLKLAPDNKIYHARTWPDIAGFPYEDTTYNMYNMNLSVINDPDQPGLACNFTPFSFYLGGKRTYWGLPNNPDYELGPLAGSACDTIVGLNEPDPPPKDGLLVYPNPVKDVLYFNPHTSASSVTGNFISNHIIYNSIGEIVLTLPSHQRKVNVSHLPAGLYFIKVTTKDKVLNAKFVKYNGE
jgi:hypothetical protein